MPQGVLPIFPADSTPITDLVSACRRGGTVWYFHGSLPIFSHEATDLSSFRMFTSQLVVNGQCRQVDIIRAFGVSAISVKRSVKRFRAGGPRAFFAKRAARGKKVWTPERLNQAQALLNEGRTRQQVAETLKIKPDTVYRALKDGRLRRVEKKKPAPTTRSERSTEDSRAGMGMACTRMIERVLAALGELHEAPCRFEKAADVSHGGLLWAVPALLNNGLLDHADPHFMLPKGYYGLYHIFLLLSFMALLRVKSSEQLRYQPPGELGQLLGLDRIPEVRTLRRKLKHLATHGNVEAWSARLSRRWMEADPRAAGVLYVDGHIRVYHGSQTRLPRRYVARERLCLRGTTDYWVNDRRGRPFFSVGTPFSDGMLAMLKERIVPRLLREVPNQPTDEALEADACLPRFTLVFDREGYSPGFFRQMWQAHRVACLSYRKNVRDEWSPEEFRERTIQLPDGGALTMKVAERGSYLGRAGKGIWLREIRKLTESGKQTAVISTDFKLGPAQLGVRLFSRWSQENFFRYMRQHFALDRVVTYELEKPDETKRVVNPAYRKVDSEIKKEAARLGRVKIAFANLALGEAPDSGELEAYSRKKGELLETIEAGEAVLADLKRRRKSLEKHIPLERLPEPDRFRQQASARKQFVDTIKMIAYRAETALAAVVRDHLTRADDARALIREILSAEADLIPDEKEKTLTVRLHHLTNPLSDRAARALADCLNESETVYPGTDLLLKFEMVST